jgi:hypothetical protein
MEELPPDTVLVCFFSPAFFLSWAGQLGLGVTDSNADPD